MKLVNYDSLDAVINMARKRTDLSVEEKNTLEKAEFQLKELKAKARTNFAACGCSSTAIVALASRLPAIQGGGEIIQKATEWLYSQASEVCKCRAPKFITGCENAVAPEGKLDDDCLCEDGLCPWKFHTGVFK